MKLIHTALILLLAFFSLSGLSESRLHNNKNFWVTAYYGGWWTLRSPPALQPDQIDLTPLTHLIYFALISHPDGSVSLKENGVDTPAAQKMTQLVHSAGKKILVSVTSPGSIKNHIKANIPVLADNIVSVVSKFDYDGVDVDWEPLLLEDADTYITFMSLLRTKLDALGKITGKKHYLLTAATIDLPAVFAKIQDKMDQINLMTYDLSGLWLEQTWFNSPVSSPHNSGLPSIEEVLKEFEAAGVRANKLGLGIDFYGYQWTSLVEDLSQPQKKWHQKPDIDPGVSYTDIVTKWAGDSVESWDKVAQVPYLSRAFDGNESYFLSFENPASCKAKVSFAQAKGLGGVMAWELGGQWLPHSTPPDPLLQSLR